VSHAALIRPLNDKGKAKLARDLAMLETTLSCKCFTFEVVAAALSIMRLPLLLTTLVCAFSSRVLGAAITKINEAGPAYKELRSFRGLVFYGDEQNPITVAGIMKESFVDNLRPSTLLDFLFGRSVEISALHRCIIAPHP